MILGISRDGAAHIFLSAVRTYSHQLNGNYMKFTSFALTIKVSCKAEDR